MASTSGSKDDTVPMRMRTRRMTRAPIMIDPDKDDSAPIDSELVPSSLSTIAPILRVANQVQKENPRVAFLCRFYAFERAHRVDPTSSGRGVRQFKTYLLQRLEKEEMETRPILGRSDPREILLFYKNFCEKNIRDLKTKTLDEMIKIYQIATVLYDVLRTVVPSQKVDEETKTCAEEVAVNRQQYEHYNILPRFAVGVGVKPAIMELPEIKAAIKSVNNTMHLPSLQIPDGDRSINDILDWLASIFGFQKGNVANQREHLILILANMDVRVRKPGDYDMIDHQTIHQLKEKIFKNYLSWCDYLNCRSNLKFPLGTDKLQLELLYIALYLLIWGEASNVRFMPECLCYIFHNMACEIYGILYSNLYPIRGDGYQTPRHGDETFLKDVIVPIYDILRMEAKRNRGGKASHSAWRNYDDLNEYFWSSQCFKLGWPMDLNADLFVHSNAGRAASSVRYEVAPGKRKPKTNFVEMRTFWHLYRSFDRMWIFLILAFQTMTIIAWSPSGSITAVFQEDVFLSVLSIFITYAFLNLLGATLDIVLSWKAWGSMKFSQVLWYILKLAVAAMWAVVLPIGYTSYMPIDKIPRGLVKFHTSWAESWRSYPLFNISVAIFMAPNILAAVVLFFPPVWKFMERSNSRIIILIMWWTQSKLFVGRSMHEDTFSLLRYTVFWVLLLICKLAFSFYVEISPLVQPTKQIWQMRVDYYMWHEIFPNATHNFGVIIGMWTPVVLVYLMDTQIWYAIFSTVVGGILGAFSHLGEIRTLGMLRSRFEAVPKAFRKHLVPQSRQDIESGPMDEERKNIAKFSQVWNEFIHSLRLEDLISHRERDLLLVPYASNEVLVVQWPPFLLASKIPIALEMAKDFKKKDDAELFSKIKDDGFMYSAVIECYEILTQIILELLEDLDDKRVIRQITEKVKSSIQNREFLMEFRMSGLPMLYDKSEKFLKLLLSDSDDDDDDEALYKSHIVNVLQDIIEIITHDIIKDDYYSQLKAQLPNLYVDDSKREQRFEKINILRLRNKSWREKVVRLHVLLTEKELAINVPMNLEARRRMIFFTNSLFMTMPQAPYVRNMLSFSVLTPYYKEDVLYSWEELHDENEDGISLLLYLQKMYPDEWNNFLERISDPKLGYFSNDREELVCHWVSYRGQTLSRTVRGMMYYRQALHLQCFLDNAEDPAIFSGYTTIEKSEALKEIFDRSQARADLKFTYVVSCLVYGNLKKSSDARDRSCANGILNLMLKYPSLRVAYIDESEDMNNKYEKAYYSVLVKGVDKLDEEIYRIKLPGPPTIIGEGKAENQNHAIIFTRGEALQTIDMNQDNYYEEAFKMRNVLEEFHKSQSKCQKPTILGLREHIFTGSVSSLAWVMSNQETSFVTISQRVLANPLKVRFHYGHPDIFDRLFHITRGGISKASRSINLTMDIFSGFNSTLRGGYVTHHEYIQVGKGRDVGMNQISLFEVKVAYGNGEQTLSRDVYRLGQRFDFYRMFSFYYTTVGFYFSSLVTVLTVYVFLYGRIYMVLSGLEKAMVQSGTISQNKTLEEALAPQSLFQIGVLLMLPMIMEIGLERGFSTAIVDFVIMQLQLASVYFTFQLGTKAHCYGRTILHGGLKYRATGRGFVVYHAKFADNYRRYSRSHFVKALELFILLTVYEAYGQSYHSSHLYLFVTWSMWFLVASWLFAPFVFNPSGFDWQKTVHDWKDWKRWMGTRGGMGINSDKSWESWWYGEQEHLRHTTIRGIFLEVLLACRFFIYQYGIVYHLATSHGNSNFRVYVLSWVVMGTVLLVLKMFSTGRRRFSTDFRLMSGILKGLLFLGIVSVITVLFVVYGLTISDLFASILAFLPTGWALLLIGQAWRRLLKCLHIWGSIKQLAQAYDYVMGFVIFMPIAVLSWFPFVSVFQTRMLFNQAFSRGLQISMILSGRKDGSLKMQ